MLRKKKKRPNRLSLTKLIKNVSHHQCHTGPCISLTGPKSSGMFCFPFLHFPSCKVSLFSYFPSNQKLPPYANNPNSFPKTLQLCICLYEIAIKIIIPYQLVPSFSLRRYTENVFLSIAIQNFKWVSWGWTKGEKHIDEEAMVKTQNSPFYRQCYFIFTLAGL